MLDLTLATAPGYLRSRGIEPVRLQELGGGVSNTVLLVESRDRCLVLKQALGKLRVEQDWFSDRRRIFRESAAMRGLASHLAGAVPEVLFEDRENLLFAMTAAPADAPTWKSQLLDGNIECGTAATIGAMLAAIARASWLDPACEREFGDQTVFDELRLDPYYRATAARHPDLRSQFESLLSETAARRLCLVHGDWSPKNFLVWDRRVLAIDFEVIHFGDPAFDSAFLLNHLFLKSFYRPQFRPALMEAARAFWAAYVAGLPDGRDWIAAATARHLGCLMLARIDGKSPAEYIRDSGLKDEVRCFARDLILHPPDEPPVT